MTCAVSATRFSLALQLSYQGHDNKIVHYRNINVGEKLSDKGQLIILSWRSRLDEIMRIEGNACEIPM